MSELNPSTHNHECGPLDCKAVIEQLWEYLDGELGEERTLLIRQHLALCSHCYPQYDFEKAFLDALADCRCTQCAPHELRGRVLDALRSAGFSATA
jgi:anti-sigma factor (TIGR02949 family)